MDGGAWAREERADFAAFLATLSPQQWQAPTLCTAWRVRDVVAHVISYDDLGRAGLLLLAARAGSSSAASTPPRWGDTTRAARSSCWRCWQITRSPGGVPAALGGRAGLAETLIHHQDIRRGLARPRPVPAERLLPALRTALIAPDIGGLWRTRGVRLVATDLRFSAGAGPEVRGAAEALLMAMAGRRGVASELSGPGQAKLAGRIGGR